MTYFVPRLSYQLPCRPSNVFLALGETLIYIIEILGLPTFYDIISEWIKPSTRPLTDEELELSQQHFGNTIKYDLVRVYSNANFTTNRSILAYVAFNTINHKRAISKDVFLHEMVHIWQYQNLGATYTIKALYAQYQGNAYDYGGFEGLYNAMLQGRSWLSFNLEQQAEIIQDYYNLETRNALNPMARSVYNYFVRQVLEKV